MANDSVNNQESLYFSENPPMFDRRDREYHRGFCRKCGSCIFSAIENGNPVCAYCGNGGPNLKWLRIKFTPVYSEATGWCCFLTGIRSDGATFGAWIVLEDEYAEGVTFDNIRSKTFEDLRRTLDGMLSEPFDGKKVPLDAYKGNADWEENES